ncbi:WGR domain-containing protein [Phenylobacterium sp.]|uniref:WGR domain-containing protein n=1 Tax=Phenylobacterium sp. TaxID=1871053 RepID=UPI00351D20BE
MSTTAAQHALANDWPVMMLRRVDPSRNMSRFWSARLQPSLFEEVLLVRAWGRIGSRGQERSYWFATRQAALAAFEKITAAKRRRGYAADAERTAVAPAGRDWTLKFPPGSHGVERPRRLGAGEAVAG